MAKTVTSFNPDSQETPDVEAIASKPNGEGKSSKAVDLTQPKDTSKTKAVKEKIPTQYDPISTDELKQVYTERFVTDGTPDVPPVGFPENTIKRYDTAASSLFLANKAFNRAVRDLEESNKDFDEADGTQAKNLARLAVKKAEESLAKAKSDVTKFEKSVEDIVRVGIITRLVGNDKQKKTSEVEKAPKEGDPMPLTSKERQELDGIEGTLVTAFASFRQSVITIGESFKRINEGKLYKEYGTLQNYCKVVWNRDYSEMQRYTLLFDTVTEFPKHIPERQTDGTLMPLPDSVGVLRALRSNGMDQKDWKEQAEVWLMAVDIAKNEGRDAPTAVMVTEAVKKYLNIQDAPKEEKKQIAGKTPQEIGLVAIESIPQEETFVQWHTEEIIVTGSYRGNTYSIKNKKGIGQKGGFYITMNGNVGSPHPFATFKEALVACNRIAKEATPDQWDEKKEAIASTDGAVEGETAETVPDGGYIYLGVLSEETGEEGYETFSSEKVLTESQMASFERYSSVYGAYESVEEAEQVYTERMLESQNEDEDEDEDEETEE